MMEAILAHPVSRSVTDIPWQIAPMVILGLFAVCAMFKGIYWLVGKMGVE